MNEILAALRAELDKATDKTAAAKAVAKALKDDKAGGGSAVYAAIFGAGEGNADKQNGKANRELQQKLDDATRQLEELQGATGDGAGGKVQELTLKVQELQKAARATADQHKQALKDAQVGAARSVLSAYLVDVLKLDKDYADAKADAAVRNGLIRATDDGKGYEVLKEAGSTLLLEAAEGDASPLLTYARRVVEAAPASLRIASVDTSGSGTRTNNTGRSPVGSDGGSAGGDKAKTPPSMQDRLKARNDAAAQAPNPLASLAGAGAASRPAVQTV